MKLESDFVLRCSSSDVRYYPQNSLNAFRAHLHESVELSDFSVALSKIVLPGNLRSVKNVFITFEARRNNTVDEEVFTCHINVELFDTSRSFFQYLGRSIKHHHFYGKEITLIGVSVLNNDSMIAIKRLKGGVHDGPINVRVSPGFAKIFGLDQLSYRMLTRHDRCLLGPARQLQPRKALPASMGYLYCDLIEPSYLNDESHLLLQSFALPSDLSRVIFKPKQLLFHPVSNRHVANIGFQLTQTDGSAYFSDDTLLNVTEDMAVIVELLFKKNRKYIHV